MTLELRRRFASGHNRVKHAVWLCELLEVGLLRSSMVPGPPSGSCATWRRYRKRLVHMRTSEIQRVEKTLEDAVIKLGRSPPRR